MMAASLQAKLFIKNCGQTAADSDMITIDSLQELVFALSNGTIATLYDVPFSHNTKYKRQTTGDTSYHKLNLTVGQRLHRMVEDRPSPVVFVVTLFCFCFSCCTCAKDLSREVVPAGRPGV